MVESDIAPIVVTYTTFVVGQFKRGDLKRLKFGKERCFSRALH
jgi:hypothetical protein